MMHDTSDAGSMPDQPEVVVRPYEPSGADEPVLAALLKGAGLPHADLGGVPSLLISIGDPPVAAAVVEIYGRAGLLRSVVVAPHMRRHGLGKRVVTAAEDAARSADMDALVLLTETAETFFQGIGYEAVERDEIPDDVRHSTEFSSVCPASAVAMRRRLSN